MAHRSHSSQPRRPVRARIEAKVVEDFDRVVAAEHEGNRSAALEVAMAEAVERRKKQKAPDSE